MDGHSCRPSVGDPAAPAGDFSTPEGDCAAPAGELAGVPLPLAMDERARKRQELCASSSPMAPAGGSAVPVLPIVRGSPADPINEEWTWKVEALKDSVCHLTVHKPDGGLSTGTGWVVRNDHTAALVTARHVLQYAVDREDGGAERALMGKVTAIFLGGKTVDLSDARALLAPKSPGDAASEQPDLAVVVLPEGRRFPALPVPCCLDTTGASKTGGDGNCSLLHWPEKSTHVVLDPRGKLDTSGSSVSTVPPPWEVRYRALTKPGSSGGMLADANCVGTHGRDGVVLRARWGCVSHTWIGVAEPS